MSNNDFSVSMFDNSPLLFGVIHVELDAEGQPEDWTFLYCNQALADMEGYPIEELIGRRHFELFPHAECSRLQPYYTAAYRKQAVEFDTVSEATGRALHINCIPMQEEGCCACLLNPRREQQYRERLESENAAMRNVHLALVSGAWKLQYNEKGELTHCGWSNTMRKMLGFESQEDFPNTFEAWAKLLHPEDKAATLKEYYDTVMDYTGEKTYDVEHRVQNKDGSYHWYRAAGRLSRRADGSPISFNGVFINVDEKHELNLRLHRVLEEAEAARNEAMIDHEIISAVSRMYFSVYRIDLPRDFYEEISSDNSVHRLTGHEGRAQRKLKEIANTIVAPAYRESVLRFFDLSTIVERLADTYTVEIEYLAMDGNWHEARFIEKKRDETGTLTHILYVTRIVSKVKQRELEQERLQIAYKAAESANEAKTNFLLNMSHDIRTPMNAILGYTRLMRNELTDPQMLHYQNMIEQSGELLLSILNNVLDMARIESGKMELDEDYHEAGNIITAVSKVFETEARKKNLKFVRTVNVQHTHILCDTTKMQEVFTNLISNAVKYTPPGGTVTMTTEELPCDREGWCCIRLTIEDTGIGMSKDFLPQLFDSFSRERNTTMGKIGGSGLGMSIVKALVELMGGKIEVESELGKGTKFTVTLWHKVVDPEAYNRQMQPEADTAIDFHGRRILLAEDNELNAEIAIALLEDMGFTVDWVTDGLLCVDKLEHVPEGTYDLILMDIQMPNVDGYKATRIIRQLPNKKRACIPIVAMTANAFDEDRRKAVAVGMNGHISKPVAFDKIKQTLTEILR